MEQPQQSHNRYSAKSRTNKLPAGRLIGVIFTLLTILAAGQSMLAQTKTSPERGFNPGNSYAMSNIETISQRGGNLMLNVPLGSLPAGRGGMSAGLSLGYNSKIWDVEKPEPVDNKQFENLIPSEDGGWRYGYQYKLKIDGDPCDGQKISLVTPDGGSHLLWLEGHTDQFGFVDYVPDGTFNCAGEPSPQAQPNDLTYFTVDGSFLRVQVIGDNDGISKNNQWTVFMPDGSQVIHNPNHVGDVALVLLQRIVDRNGNFVDITESYDNATPRNLLTTTIADQMEREVVIEYEPDPTNSPNQDLIYSKGYNSADLVTKVQWKTITVRRTYLTCPVDCSGGDKYRTTGQNFRVVDKIYLPSQIAGNLHYEFDYNADATSNPSTGWGEVSEVKLPSGAYSTYQYEYYDTTSGVRTYEVLGSYPKQKTLNYLKEYDGVTPSLVTDTWTYSGTGFGLAAPTAGYYSTTAPDGSISTEYYNSWNGASAPTVLKYNDGFWKPYKSVSGSGVVTERIYANNLPTDSSIIAAANQFVKYELTSIPDNSGTLVKTAIKEYSQDKNGNMTEVKEYDFVPYSGTGSAPRDSNGRPTGLPSGITLKRVTQTEYYNPVPDSASTTYTDADSYHLSSSPRLLKLAKAMEVRDGANNPVSRSELTYDYTSYSTNTKGGNPTESKAWDSFKGGASRAYSNPLTSTNSISTTTAYNSYGAPTSVTDANGNQTQITYGSVSTGSGTVTDLYPTQTVSAYGTSIAQTTQAVYDFSTGLVTQATALGNTTGENVVSQTIYDALGRPIISKTAVGKPEEVWTKTDYEDQYRRVITRSDLFVKDDGRKVSTQFYDQLGRVRLAKALEDSLNQSATNETEGIKVQTRYLATGACTFDSAKTCSFQLVSNPYRAATSSAATTEPSMGWTRSQTISTGNHSETETYSGATLPLPFLTSGYNTGSTGKVQTDTDADRTLVTDQAGKQRISKSNALGQLINVWEVKESDSFTESLSLGSLSLNALKTSYGYNTLGKMVKVTQGTQNRFFMYDSLGRLRRVRQPEQQVNTALNTSGNPDNNSWTAGFAHDDNGNILTATDSRNVAMTNAYDALNRVQTRSYSDATPTVTYTYEDLNVPYSKGRLTQVSSSVSTTKYTAFDILGRMLSSQQITDGQTYSFGYAYNLSGVLIEETYPSGRVVKNVLDNEGELSIVQSKKNSNAGFWNYAQHFTRTAAGAIISMQLGNGHWESAKINSRLQTTELGLGNTGADTAVWKVNYDYGELDPTTGAVDAGKNAGSMARQTLTVAGMANPVVQTYAYDALDRLTEAKETSGASQNWTQTFQYDRYGNRVSFNQQIGGQQTSATPTIDASTNRFTTGQGYTYDYNGNLIQDADGRQFTFDGDNKQTEVKDAGNNIVGTYYYDGEGKRIKKVTNLETTVFVYSGGKLAAEYSTRRQRKRRVLLTQRPTISAHRESSPTRTAMSHRVET